jgi:hypothetical protein
MAIYHLNPRKGSKLRLVCSGSRIRSDLSDAQLQRNRRLGRPRCQ